MNVTHKRPDTFILESAGRNYENISALNPTTINIKQGERVAIVGPSGSGKTTLLSLFNSTVQASSGKITVLGNELGETSGKTLKKIRSKIATIPQNLALVDSLRVWQNIITGQIGCQGFLGNLIDLIFPSKNKILEIHSILKRLGIEEKLFATTSNLSRGQKQRVALARAIYQNPQVILADEPVSSVDPARAENLVQLLNQISEEENITLVMSLHNLELAKAHFPRLIGLRNGEIQFDSNPADLNESKFKDLYTLSEREILDDGEC
ncbi:MAG TPA: ATP-binding cassette domain-containing protein [Verrucomicrobia bacterium]|nr:ATP-binding cassette domain-containing protein [Verrucomicrobiales bacterium]HIL53677.1 ATP-binding cassette domain-containing protein [Verrucomicrobiota bacterium]